MTRYYFFDTSAFIELIVGNPAYAKYGDYRAITTIFNLTELNWNLMKKLGKKKADEFIDMFFCFLVDVTPSDVKDAMNLKKENKNWSVPDCIGYTVARRMGVNFLTGDNDFKGVSGVEFVK